MKILDCKNCDQVSEINRGCGSSDAVPAAVACGYSMDLCADQEKRTFRTTY